MSYTDAQMSEILRKLTRLNAKPDREVHRYVVICLISLALYALLMIVFL